MITKITFSAPYDENIKDFSKEINSDLSVNDILQNFIALINSILKTSPELKGIKTTANLLIEETINNNIKKYKFQLSIGKDVKLAN